MSEENQEAKVAGRNEFHVERGSDGKRIPEEVFIKNLGKSIKVVRPSWGDGKEFFHDFSGEEDADAVDSDKIAKHFKKLIVEPDLGDLTAAELDEDWDSAIVQEMVEKLGELYGGSNSGEEEGETDQKKSES